MKDKLNKISLAVIFIAAIFIRIYYIHYTPTWIRQHDVIGFGTGIGQAAFIEYFYEKIRLIDFDPREIWGFFQPPLHHMIAGLWLRLMVRVGDVFGWSMDTCREKVQVLTAAYSLVTVFFGAKIMKQLKVSGGAFTAGCALMALHPCLIQMSGSINNDMLCVMLQIMDMYFFFLWMEKENMGTMILGGLCIGLSMMAKLSGIMLAVPMGCIMFYRLILSVKNKDRKKTTSYIKQYLCFAIASIPIGIWSPVRNFLKFGVPLAYTPEVGEPIEGLSPLGRLLYTGGEQTPFTCMIATGHEYDEFNVPLAILKTSLFGEADFSAASPYSTAVGWALLFAGILVALAVAYSLFYLVYRKTGGQYTAFMLIYILFSLGFLVRLCFAIPNFSSQDFRYIAHIVIPSGCAVAMWMQRRGVIVRMFIVAVTVLFCASSLLTYYLAGNIAW